MEVVVEVVVEAAAVPGELSWRASFSVSVHFLLAPFSAVSYHHLRRRGIQDNTDTDRRHPLDETW